MRCCISEAEKQNERIQKEIEDEKRALHRHQTFLFIGSRASGKNTFIKQMKLLNGGGELFQQELAESKPVIIDNILTSVNTLIYQASLFEYPLAAPNEKNAQIFVASSSGPERTLTKELADIILKLWQDPAIQQAFERASEYHLGDSTRYYLDNIHRIAAPDYVPSNDDLLRACVKSKRGIRETIFNSPHVTGTFVDIGGVLNGERRKWIHLFEEVKYVVFCVAISDYDVKLIEDPAINKLREAEELFAEILGSPYFRYPEITLLFNKIDVFKDKIKHVPITVCYPEYTGPQTFEATSSYIEKRFMDRMHYNQPREVFSLFTCAVDTTFTKYTFEAIHEFATLTGS